MTANGDSASGVTLGVGRESGNGTDGSGVDVRGSVADTEVDVPDALPVGSLGAGVPMAAGLTAQSSGSTGRPLVEGLGCGLLSSMLALDEGSLSRLHPGFFSLW